MDSVLTIFESLGINAQLAALLYIAWKYDKRLTIIESKLL